MRKHITPLRCGIPALFGAMAAFCFFFISSSNAQAQSVCTEDLDGIEGGSQSDITQICYEPSIQTVTFSWDPTTIWNGGNTGDNCIFFDTDGNGNINSAFCLSIASSVAGAVIAAGYPATFTCSDKKPDRCTNPVGPTSPLVSTCTLATQSTDPFGGADTPNDLRATCVFDPADFGGTVPMPTTSCAFNSANPNSNPSDCIVHNPIAAPSLSISKTGSPLTYTAVGDVINYDYVLTNIGNTIFNSISVTDDKIASVTCPALPSYGLTPGQSVTCTASYTIQSGDPRNGSVTNIAFGNADGTNSPADNETVTYVGPPFPDLIATKSVEVWDPGAAGLYAVPGNDVIYTITVTNSGDGVSTIDTMELIDIMPGDIDFYNGDIDDGGPETDPVIFSDFGSGLTFTYSADVAYSDSGTAPADFASCGYTPSAGYDPNVSYICINPKGIMNARTPDRLFSFVSSQD